MPHRKGGKRKRNPVRRKAYRTKRRMRKRQRKVLSITMGMPSTKVLKLRYATDVVLQGTLGGLVSHQYVCNGLYDPDFAIGGHQPMGYNQYITNYYNGAVVLGSKCTVKFHTAGISTGSPTACGVYSYDPSNSLATATYTNWRAFKEAGFRMGTLGTVKSQCTGKAYFSQKKCIGTNPMSTPSNWNTITSNPVSTWNYYIWVQSLDEVSTSTNCVCEVVIDYIVKFIDRRPLVPN